MGGQNTPWGAPQYQAPNPNGVSAPAYLNNPSSQPNFDTSALANRAIANANGASAYANQQAMAQNASNSGGGSGKSGQSAIQNMDLAANQENNASNLQNQQALQGFQNQIAEQNNQNQFNANQYGQNLQGYYNQAQLAQADQKNRQQAVGQLGPIGSFSELFGGY